MRKLVSLFLCLMVIGSLVIGCSSGGTEKKEDTQPATVTGETTKAPETAAGPKTVITLLRPGDEVKVKKWTEPMLADFSKANPDIDLQFMYESWAGWIQKYPTLMAANTQPEVIFWWDNQLKEKGVADKLVPLEDYVDKAVIAAFPESVLSVGKIDGKLMYLPVSVDPAMIYYNKDLYKQAGLDPENPPKTWDELLSASKAIYEKTGVPAIGFMGKTGANTLQEFIALFYHQGTGKAFLDENNKPLFNTPEAVKALQYIKELQKYSQLGPENYARGDLRPLFRDGKIAMAVDGSWIVPTLQAKYGENLDNSIIGVMVPPQGPVANIDWVGTNGWVITNKDKAVAAGKVVSFISSGDQVYKHHMAYGNAPLLDYETKQPGYQYKFWGKFLDAINQNTLIPMIARNHPTPKAFYVELEDIWQQFLLDKIDAKGALDLAEKKVNELNSRAGVN